MSEEFPQGRYDDLVPDDGRAVCGMRYVRYIEADGQTYFRWEFGGQQMLSLTVGDLYRILAELCSDDEMEEPE